MLNSQPDKAIRMKPLISHGLSGLPLEPLCTDMLEDKSSHLDATENYPLFFGVNPEINGTSISDSSQNSRVFFPCNREDALLLLAGLCISTSFPDPEVKLATDAKGLALIEHGLRLSEETLLCGGRQELFPILIEIRPEAVEVSRQALEYTNIVQLVFRQQEEADAFRYRPVDEFDTQEFSCGLDAACFGLDGSSRFELRSCDISELPRTAGVVDRVLAGIHCMLSLGKVEPSCRHAIASFLSRDVGIEDRAEGVSLSSVLETLKTPLTDDIHSERSAIVRAFARTDGLSSRTLLDAIADELSPARSDRKDSIEIEARWLKVAYDVISNRIALTGDRLSDEKSVFLRGALLAIVADSPIALGYFLRAEKPSGPKVTSWAAFLVGLKQGLISMSWKVKGPKANSLSAAAASLLKSLPCSEIGIDQYVSVLSTENNGTSLINLHVGGVQLEEWTIENEIGRVKIEGVWLAELQRLNCEIFPKDAGQFTWHIILPSGEKVELEGCAIGSDHFPVLKWYPPIDQMLKKDREIKPLNRAGGRLWYPRYGSEGDLAMWCELPFLSVFPDLGLVENALREAVKLYFVSKPLRKRRKTSAPLE